MKKTIAALAALILIAALFAGCSGGAKTGQELAPGESFTETSPEGLYDETGVYMYAPDGSTEVSYGVVEREDGSRAAQMRFTRDGIAFTYRAEPMDAAPEGGCAYLSTVTVPEAEAKTAVVNISGLDADIIYRVGGEGYVYWFDSKVGAACCVSVSTAASEQILTLYGNTLYAFLHSDLMSAVKSAE